MEEEPTKEQAPAAEPETPETTFGADAEGFQSTVHVEAAFDGDKITYMSIGDKRFDETPGFGARALEPEAAAAFIGKTVPMTVEDIDVLTGATFTKTAVVEALNKAYAKYQAAQEAPAEETSAAPENAVTASAQGFGGPVAVEAAFDDEGKITYIKIGDDQFAETPGLGARALEDEFQAQFIGKQMPLTLADIDAIAGATVTSTAVVDALNEAYASIGAAAEPAEEPVEEPVAEAIPENVVTASAQGFGGPVAVEAAFDEAGKITYIKIGDDNFAETPGLGARALEDEFQAQFIGKQMPLTLDGIDAIAGATVTSTAVVDALNKAYEQAQPAAPAEPVAVEEPPEEKPAEQPEETVSESVPMKITAEFEDGKLTALSIEPAEVEAEMQEKFLGAEMPVSVDQTESTALTVAVALNKAYDRYLAEQPTAEPEKEPAQTETEPAKIEGLTAVETISFFTDIQVKAAFEDGKVSDLAIADKPVGSEAEYAPSAEEESLKALFLGQPLPLSVDAKLTPYAAAVAAAINQAYGPVDVETAEEPSEEPVTKPVEEPAAEPVEEPAAEPAEEKPEEPAASELALRVTAEFENDVLTGLTVLEKAADSDEFVPCAEEEALKEKFIGQALPLDTNQPSVLESVAAIGINKAYYDAAHEAEAQQPVEESDEQAPVPAAEDEDDEPWYIGEAISFFTSIQAKVKITPALTVEAVKFEEKEVGAEAYQPSERNDELEALFVGEPLPLDVAVYEDDPFRSAAAIAVNEAFEQSPYLVVYNFNSTALGVGESISFFTKYTFAAAFTGNTFMTCGGYKTAVGSEIRERLDCGAINELFTGLKMPLDIHAYTIPGIPEYEMTAIVIALNQAYENSLAGLQ